MAVETLTAPRRIDIPAIVKESFLTALAALALAAPLIGIQIVDVSGGISYVTHLDRGAHGVAAVFLGRLALRSFVQARQGRPMAAHKGTGLLTRLGVLASTYATPISIAWLALAGLLPFTNNYYIDLWTTLLIYIML